MRTVRRTGAAGYDLTFVGLVSAGILVYELLLTRILSVHYWSYFASMIVSLAMLGFAASGTLLFILTRGRDRAGAAVPWAALGFVAFTPLCPLISETIDCMPLVVLWDPLQLCMFALHYLVLLIPFLFGGFIVGWYFVSGRYPAGQVYFANMLGSGMGILIALICLCGLRPATALALAVVPVGLAAWLCTSGPVRRGGLAAALLVALASAGLAPDRPRLSQYKGLHGVLLMPDAVIERSGWNAYGHLAVVDSETIRYAPGLSLGFTGTIPEQKAIFTNGDDMEAVCAGGAARAAFNYFDSMLSALAYSLHDRPRVLVIGAGGAMAVWNAVLHGAAAVDAVENNTAIADLMTGPLAAFAGDPYRQPGVRLITAGGRTFVNRSPARYDLVVVSGKRSLFAAAAGTSAGDPDYLLTQEALADYRSVLAPGGVLAIETWLNLPPRHGARLFAAAAAALRGDGHEPAQYLAAVRSLRTSLLLVFRDPVSARRIAALRDFCDARGFDVICHPGVTPGTVNRFNVVAGAPYSTLYQEILAAPKAAVRTHPFRIEPATDDRPYFSHFFKWSALPQLLEKTGRNVAVHVGWGYTFLLITLAQAIPLGALLILGPLSLAQRRRRSAYPRPARVYAYFTCLGFGFMFLELAAIQQFARFLPHPVYAFGVTIGIILLFSGAGSLVSGHRRLGNARVFTLVVIGILLHLALWQLSIRSRSPFVFGLDVTCIAALAFFMGMPFPRGVEQLRRRGPDLIPWAWGINGFVSVLAVLTAGLASLSLGLSALTALAAVCYLLAAATVP